MRLSSAVPAAEQGGRTGRTGSDGRLTSCSVGEHSELRYSTVPTSAVSSVGVKQRKRSGSSQRAFTLLCGDSPIFW